MSENPDSERTVNAAQVIDLTFRIKLAWQGVPEWFVKQFDEGKIHTLVDSGWKLRVHTIDGWQLAEPSDYIVLDDDKLYLFEQNKFLQFFEAI